MHPTSRPLGVAATLAILLGGVAATAASPSSASATGRCAGSIGHEPRGSNGFGYDPLFVLQDGRTMAELGSAEKNQISHRGKALREILPAVLIAIGAHRFHAQGAGQ